MITKITKAQLEEIEAAYSCEGKEAAYALLKEYAGLEARPYTAYDFYDECGNYVGCSDSYSIRDLLKNAYIKITDGKEDDSDEEADE